MRLFQNIKSSSNFKIDHINGALMLHNSPKMAKTQSPIWQCLLLTLINNLFVLWRSERLSIIILHLFTKSDVSVIKMRKDLLSEIRCNQKVTGRFTFDLYTQNSIYDFHFPFIVWIWSKKPDHCKDSELLHGQKCSVYESLWPWS